MISKGAIQEYIVDINFSILGYRICYIVTKQVEENTSKTNISNSSINNRKKIIEGLTRFGDILAEIEVLGGSSIFRIATKALIHKENQLKDYHKIYSSLLVEVRYHCLWVCRFAFARFYLFTDNNLILTHSITIIEKIGLAGFSSFELKLLFKFQRQCYNSHSKKFLC